ncbi:hypothetical protein GBA52_012140 [Prunus armeniaca]|nr:hypothetical protein GBA52_012140 [Prunus armeniaca]
MANLLINRTLKSIGNSKLITALSSRSRHFSSIAAVEQPHSDGPSSSFSFSSDGQENKNNRNNQDDSIHIKPSSSSSKHETAFVVGDDANVVHDGVNCGKEVLQPSDDEEG